MEELKNLLIKLEKKLCLDKFGKDHEKFAHVDVEKDDFQDIVIEGDPNYCGKDFISQENIEQVDTLIVKKLAQHFKLESNSPSDINNEDIQEDVQPNVDSSDESEDSEESL